MRFRKQVGWCVAQVYRMMGLRKAAVNRLSDPRAILPVVFHAAEPQEVRAVLDWLRQAGVLDRVELSFDDGWSQFLRTIRVLEEFNKSAILFIAPGETMRGRVWTDGTTVAQRQSLYGVSEEERCRKLEEWGIDTPRHLMTEHEVREVAKHPLVKIGNHTWSHLSCTSRPAEEVVNEIARAQFELAKWCGYSPTEFAYPFGRGTPELDAEIRAMGLTPHYTRQGFLTEATRGAARNMVYEGMSLAENIGRILMAWPRVGETL